LPDEDGAAGCVGPVDPAGGTSPALAGSSGTFFCGFLSAPRCAFAFILGMLTKNGTPSLFWMSSGRLSDWSR
jgi:hypothetical protein